MRIVIIISIFIIWACSFGQAQIITTIAGSGPWFGAGHGAFSGDHGPATAAEFFQPCSLTIDEIGNIYIADEYNIRIRKIDTYGIITTIAGTGVMGYGGDDSVATVSKFCDLGYIKLGNDGNLYIPDICNNRIRKINLTTSIISTCVGTSSTFCNRDTGIATSAFINFPFGITFDRFSNLYFGDACNYIDKVNLAGNISRVVGSDSVIGYAGDNGLAINAKINHPVDIAIDYDGNLFISDLDNDVIRKVNASGIITNYAGTNVWGYYGDGGPATLAQLNYPEGIVVDGVGNVFFSDELNDVVRKVDHTTGIITTIAGNGTYGYSGDGFPATDAQLGHPTGLAFDASGNLYIADWYNNRIRKVTNVGVPLGLRKTEQEKAEVKIFPNPARNEIIIEGRENCYVRIFNIVGQLCIQHTLLKNRETSDISSLQNGVYLVEVLDITTGMKVVMKIQKE